MKEGIKPATPAYSRTSARSWSQLVRLLTDAYFVDHFAYQLHLHYVRHQLRVLQVPATTSEFGLNYGKAFGDLNVSST